MELHTASHRRWVSRNAVGPDHAEAFLIIAVATILLTRLYLSLTGYPQVGGGQLHIAHALYGGALMMVALLVGWLLLGAGTRAVTVALGGVGLGLFLDEVGKFVTKTNDYFYGPSAEIMYILIVVVLVATRLIRAIRPLTAQECLASATAIAADGLARGLADRRRDIGLHLVQRARAGGADGENTDRVQALLLSAGPAADRLYAIQRRLPRLIPGFFRSPRWVPVVGWLLVAAALGSLFFRAFGIAFGGHLYQDKILRYHLAGLGPATVILMVSAGLTLAIAVPALIARRRTDSVWPLRLLHTAALLFTLLDALVHFATEGFAALITLAIGLFALAILTYQLDVAERTVSAPDPSRAGPYTAVR
jgi:hypothetical protein